MKRVALAALFAQFAGLAVVALFCLFPVESDDLFLYLKSGELIWQQRAIPVTDPFSFTANHIRWNNHEWLTCVGFYLLFRAGGYNLLIIFKTLLVLLSFGLALWSSRRWSRNSWLLPLLLIMLAYSASDRFIERAHLVNLVFFTGFTLLALHWRDGARVPGFWFPLITLAWINVHSGAILAPVIFGIILVCDSIQCLLAKRFGRLRSEELPSPTRLRRGPIWLLLQLPALVITPFGTEPVLLSARFPSWDIYRHYVYEWMRVYSPLYIKQPVFAAFVVVVVVTVLALLANLKNLKLSDVGLAALGLTLGFSAIRFLDILAIVAFIVIARQLASFKWAAGNRENRWFHHSAVALVSLLCAVVIAKQGYRIVLSKRTLGLGMAAHVYPIIPLKYLDELGIYGNMFNQYDLGSYLLWCCYPQRKVFIDGRNQLYPVEFYKEYLSINLSAENLEKVMDTYDINYILLLNQASPPPHPKGVYDFLSESKQWALIYWDDLFLVYLRNSPQNQSIIEKYRFHYYDPVLPPEQTLGRYLFTEPRACLAELERVLTLNPQCYRARLLLENSKKALQQAGTAY